MVPSENLQDGTIEFVTRRLERWGRNAPRGLALVTFDSEFARRQVVDRLKEAFSQAGIPFHEIALPVRQPIVQVIDELVKQLVALEPGIVSISGFATASEPERPLGEVVHIFNFNRENLAQSHLRSIWWVTREFGTRLLVDAPDLHSWFLVRLELTEQVVDLTPEKPLFLSGEHSPIPVEQARRHSAYLAERFETALKQDAPLVDLTQLAVDSIKALLSAELEQEARSLGQNFIEKLELLLQRPPTSLSENPQQQIISLANLANLYLTQGWYSNSEQIFQKALSICVQQLGDKHSLTADLLNNLAVLHQSQGRYSEAVPLFRRALAIRVQLLGEDHPSVGQSLSNLAELYRLQGNYQEAAPLHQRALEIRIQQLGPDHPDTANSFNNLANLYHDLGRYQEAEALYQQALKIREQHLGPNHPETATSLNNLATLYCEQGRYIESESLYQRALTIDEKQLGLNHPSTAKTLNNFAGLYYSQGKYQEAEGLYQRALKIREQQLGSEHPLTATIFHNLASLYFSQGKYPEAILLCQQALAIRQKQFGPGHPEVAKTLYVLALLYQTQGQCEKAETCYLKAIPILKTVLGEDHPDTKLVKRNYLSLLRQMGRTPELD